MQKFIALLLAFTGSLSLWGAHMSGSDFQSEGYVVGDEFFTGRDDTNGVTETSYWFTADTDDFEGTIASYTNSASTEVKYLDFESNITNPVYRTVKNSYELTSATGLAGITTNIGKGLFMDTRVKFTPYTVTDVHTPPIGLEGADVDANCQDKLVIWLREVETTNELGEVTRATTNLIATAGYYKNTQNALSVHHYELNLPAGITYPSLVTNFHRLTIKAFENITETSSDQAVGFVVYLDEQALSYSSSDNAGVDKSAITKLNGTAAKYYKEGLHQLFPSLRKKSQTDTQTISAVGYSGTGAVQEIYFDDYYHEVPDWASDDFYFTIAWTDGVTSFTYGTFTTNNLTGAGSMQFHVRPSVATAAITGVNYDTAKGYKGRAGLWHDNSGEGEAGISCANAGTDTNDYGTFALNGATKFTIAAFKAKYKVGSDEYDTLWGNSWKEYADGALEAVLGSKGTLKLCGNTIIDEGAGKRGFEFDGSAELTIDLNGYTLQASSNSLNATIFNAGSLTITNSAPERGGKVLAPINCSEGKYAVLLGDTADTKIYGGEFDYVIGNGESSAILGELKLYGGKYWAVKWATDAAYNAQIADYDQQIAEAENEEDREAIIAEKEVYIARVRGFELAPYIQSGYTKVRSTTTGKTYFTVAPAVVATISKTDTAGGIASLVVTQGLDAVTAAAATDDYTVASGIDFSVYYKALDHYLFGNDLDTTNATYNISADKSYAAPETHADLVTLTLTYDSTKVLPTVIQGTKTNSTAATTYDVLRNVELSIVWDAQGIYVFEDDSKQKVTNTTLTADGEVKAPAVKEGIVDFTVTFDKTHLVGDVAVKTNGVALTGNDNTYTTLAGTKVTIDATPEDHYKVDIDATGVTVTGMTFIATQGATLAVSGVMSHPTGFPREGGSSDQLGTAEHPYELATAADFAALKSAVEDCTASNYVYKVTGDNIALTDWKGTGIFADMEEPEYTDGCEEENGSIKRAPSGKSKYSFEGVLDGNNKTINITFATGKKYNGLFGATYNASVKDLTVNVNANTAEQKGIGAIVGYAAGNLLLTNITVTGTIGTSAYRTKHNTGGLIARVGSGADGTVRLVDCVNAATIYANYTKVGGIVSHVVNYTKAKVEFVNCWNKGNIDNTGGSNAQCDGTGGIMGWSGYRANYSYVNCTNTGTLTVTKTYPGSFVGYAHLAAASSTGLVARADQKPCGSSSNGGISDFAIVDTPSSGLVTYCAKPTTFGAYKVMQQSSASITLNINDAGTFSLNTNLVAWTGTVALSAESSVAFEISGPVDVDGTLTWTVSKKIFVVTFKPENTQADIVTNVAYGTLTATIAPTLQKAGYDFAGWQPALDAIVESNSTYTAQWTSHVYFPQGGIEQKWADRDGTAAKPFVIRNAADFADLQEMVAVGQTTEGVYFELVADVTLGTVEKPWTGIVTYSHTSQWSKKYGTPFKGTFDGGNYQVDLNMGPGSYVGLFNKVADATIKNMKVKVCSWANVTAGQKPTWNYNCCDNGGAFVGTAVGNCTFENLTALSDLDWVCMTGEAAGIVGQFNDLTGGSTSYFNSCTNKMNLSTTSWHAGGILAVVQKDYTKATAVFSNCYNSGNIRFDKPIKNDGGPISLGGILGCCFRNDAATFANCTSVGENSWNTNWVYKSAEYGSGYMYGVSQAGASAITRLGTATIGVTQALAQGDAGYPDFAAITAVDATTGFYTNLSTVTSPMIVKLMRNSSAGVTLGNKDASLTIVTNLNAWSQGTMTTAPYTNGCVQYTGTVTVSVPGCRAAPRVAVTATGVTFKPDPYFPQADIEQKWADRDGTTAEKAFVIRKYEDLVALKDMVAAGTTTAGVFFEQVADIDMATNETRAAWTGIGSDTYKFAGHYSGAGYSLNNFTLAQADKVGLFACIEGAEMSDLIININWTSDSDSTAGAALVGKAYGGTINRVKVTGTIDLADQAAGLVYRAYGNTPTKLTFNNCTNAANISIGGAKLGSMLHARDTYSTCVLVFNGCVNTGTLKSTKVIDKTSTADPIGCVGGIFGWNGYSGTDTTFTNCISTGTIDAPGCWAATMVGQGGGTFSGTNVGLDGYMAIGGRTAANDGVNFALVDTPVEGQVTYVKPAETVSESVTYKVIQANGGNKNFTLSAAKASLTVVTNFAAYTGTVTVSAPACRTAPLVTGTATSVTFTPDTYFPQADIEQKYADRDGTTAEKAFVIRKYEDLVALQEMVAAGTTTAGVFFEQTADIDFTGKDAWAGIGLAKKAPRFCGTYDGKGFKILNVTLDGSVEYAALFGQIGAGADVKNISELNIAGVGNYKDDSCVGGLIGYAEGAVTVSDVKVTGTIGTPAQPMKDNVSGLICRANTDGADVFTRLEFAGTIYAESSSANRKVAGILGYSANQSGKTGSIKLDACVCSGSLTNNASVDFFNTAGPQGGVGGLMGYLWSGCGSLTVKDCVVSGTVAGNANVMPGAGVFGAAIGVTITTEGTNKVAKTSFNSLKLNGNGNSWPEMYGVENAEDSSLLDLCGASFTAGKTYYPVKTGLTPIYQFTEAGTIAFNTNLYAATAFNVTISDADKLVLSSNDVAGVVTFTAAWHPYVITFNKDTGVLKSKLDVVYGETLTAAKIPDVSADKVGYTFKGWDEDPTNATVTADKTYTAQWEINKYEVTYTVDGEAGTPETVDHGNSPANIPAIPAKKGYSFTGWTPSDPTNAVIVCSTNFATVYAAIPYAITYDYGAGAGPAVSNQMTYMIGTTNQTFGLVAPTPAVGYAFNGYALKDAREGVTFNDKTNMVIAADAIDPISVQATYAAIEYNITYVLNGGEASGNPKTYTVVDSITLNNASKTGYTFDGWTWEGQATPVKNVSLTAGRTGDITFTANYTINSYGFTVTGAENATVTVTTNGYSFAYEAGLEFPYNTAWSVYATPATGYAFAENATTNAAGTMAAEAKEVTLDDAAKINYTITYVYGAGTAPATANVASYTISDEEQTWTLNRPTPAAGYDFTSWTVTEKTGVSINGDTLKVAADTIGAFTVTANYTIQKFTVTFDANGKTATGMPSELVDVEYGSKIAKPAEIPTAEHVLFNGWYKDAGCANAWAWDVDTVICATNLFAGWTNKIYTITTAGGANTDVTLTDLGYGAGKGATNQVITITATPKNGFTYAGVTLATGWATNELGAATNAVTIAGDAQVTVPDAVSAGYEVTFEFGNSIKELAYAITGGGASGNATSGSVIKVTLNEQIIITPTAADSFKIPVFTSSASGIMVGMHSFAKTNVYTSAGTWMITVAEASTEDPSAAEAVKEATVEKLEGSEAEKADAKKAINAATTGTGAVTASEVAGWVSSDTTTSKPTAAEMGAASAQQIQLSVDFGTTALVASDANAIKIDKLEQTTTTEADKTAYNLTFEFQKNGSILAATKAAKEKVEAIVKATTDVTDWTTAEKQVTPTISADGSIESGAITVKIELPKTNAKAFMKIQK